MSKTASMVTCVSLLLYAVVVSTGCSVSETDIAGTYVNTNYSNPICCVEAPHVPDTLVLFGDGTMHSGFYGNGTWELDHGGSEVHWSYPYELGMAGYTAGVDKGMDGSVRLILNYKMDHHYAMVR